MTQADAILLAIVALAFLTEAAVGFGATVITVALGALFVPIDRLLPAFVPLNVLLSTFILARSWRFVDARMLFLRVLPAMALGFPIGLWAAARLPTSTMQLAFAAFVLVLSVVELARLLRATGSASPVAPPIAFALLFVGGVVHGAFATGGPPAVYVCGRTLHDKRAFRATLSALWLVLNVALVVVFGREGRLDAASLRSSEILIPGLVAGAWLGDVLHGKIPERTFRIALFSLLVVVAIVLAIRR